MRFIKKNKFSVFIMIIFTAVVILSTVVYNTFFVGKGAVYGDRLEGIEEVPIKSSEKKKLVSAIEEKDVVKEVSTTLHGKIFNVIIVVNWIYFHFFTSYICWAGMLNLQIIFILT